MMTRIETDNKLEAGSNKEIENINWKIFFKYYFFGFATALALLSIMFSPVDKYQYKFDTTLWMHTNYVIDTNKWDLIGFRPENCIVLDRTILSRGLRKVTCQENNGQGYMVTYHRFYIIGIFPLEDFYFEEYINKNNMNMISKGE